MLGVSESDQLVVGHGDAREAVGAFPGLVLVVVVLGSGVAVVVVVDVAVAGGVVVESTAVSSFAVQVQVQVQVGQSNYEALRNRNECLGLCSRFAVSMLHLRENPSCHHLDHEHFQRKRFLQKVKTLESLSSHSGMFPNRWKEHQRQ